MEDIFGIQERTGTKTDVTQVATNTDNVNGNIDEP